MFVEKGAHMRPRFIIILLLFFFSNIGIGHAQSQQVLEAPDPPDISHWKLNARYVLDIRLSDSITGQLGFIVDYSSPDNSLERVRVIMVHGSRIYVENGFERPTSLNQQEVIERGAEKDKDTELTKLFQESDKIAYFRWCLKADPRTGNDIQVGPTEYWLLDPRSDTLWIYRTSDQEKIGEGSFSEPSLDNTKKWIIVGRVYSLGEESQIITIDQDDLPRKGGIK